MFIITETLICIVIILSGYQFLTYNTICFVSTNWVAVNALITSKLNKPL